MTREVGVGGRERDCVGCNHLLTRHPTPPSPPLPGSLLLSLWRRTRKSRWRVGREDGPWCRVTGFLWKTLENFAQLSFTHTHTYIHSLSLSLPLFHTHTHARMHTHSRTHTYPYPHTNSPTFTPPPPTHTHTHSLTASTDAHVHCVSAATVRQAADIMEDTKQSYNCWHSDPKQNNIYILKRLELINQ